MGNHLYTIVNLYGEEYSISTKLEKLLKGSLEDLNPLSTLGGKGWAVKIYNPIIEYCAREHNITTYVEGTGGGCKMLANLNVCTFSKRIYNELDYDIYCYFDCLSDRKSTKIVIETVRYLTENIESERLFNLAFQNRENKCIAKELAAAFAFIRSFGSDKGDRISYNDEKFCQSMINSKRYLALSVYNSILQGIEAANTDCFNLIRNYNQRSDCFYFGDHPYFNTKTYAKNDWGRERYAEFVKIVQDTKLKMMICDSENPYYDILVKYCGWRKYFIQYKTNNRSSVKGKKASKMPEQIWVNFNFPSDLLPESAKRIA